MKPVLESGTDNEVLLGFLDRVFGGRENVVRELKRKE